MAEFKEIVEKSKKVLSELEEKVDDVREDLGEEAKELWEDIRRNFLSVGEKLKETVSEVEEKKDRLKPNLDILEAREKLEKVKETAEEFTKKVSEKAEAEMDIAALRAHLAKKEAEDLWEEKRKKLSYAFQEKEHEVTKMAKEAAEEIESFFEGLLTKIKERKA